MKKQTSLFHILKPYKHWLIVLFMLTLLSNGIGLILPRLIEKGIDQYAQQPVGLDSLLWQYLGLTLVILLLSLGQSLVQTLASERVAFDLRTQAVARLSQQRYTQIQELGPATLLTRLTSDIDAIKLFVSQVIVAMVSSLLLMLGASAILLWMHWRLALAVLATIPILALMFRLIFKQGRDLFSRAQGIRDQLNQVINQSILGAALIRVLHSRQTELQKFDAPNTESQQVGLRILRMFASLMPLISFMAGLGSLIIVLLGGHFVMQNELTLGELAAFNAYLLMLIFPILIMGFTSQSLARAAASYRRLAPILNLPESPEQGHEPVPVQSMTVQNLGLTLGGKPILKNLNFEIKPGSRTAILGPTAAGKTSLLQLLMGLYPPDQGQILYNGQPLAAEGQNLPPGLSIVFQDALIFQLSLRENIAFGPQVSEAALDKAIRTAELAAFIETLPQGLDTLVSERGLSLSGGQKQRLMLARALAQSPKILLLDDFTARVDAATEARILANLRQAYPDLTLLSVTQKIAAVQDFEHILLLMQGELVASGNHQSLMQSSPEYMQIYQSQQSTEAYESAN